MSAIDYAAFTAWLRERIAADGRLLSVIGREAGGYETYYAVLKRGLAGARLQEDTVRKLAAYFHDDPDRVAALARFGDRRAVSPSPMGFRSLHDFFRAALEARAETPYHAARGAGVDGSHLQAFLVRGEGGMDRPTLDKYADYFGVDRAELRALRPKSASRIAIGQQNGRAIVERLGVEHMRAQIARARAVREAMGQDVRQEHSRRGGLAAQIQEDPEHRRQRLTAANGERRRKALERGSWFRTEEARTQGLERMRAAGLRRAAGPEFDRYRYEFRQPGMREKFVALGTLGQIRQRVKQHDPALLDDVDAQIKAELRRLQNPDVEGRPSTLLENRRLAIELAWLQHDGGMSAGEVAQAASLPASRDANGSLRAGTTAKKLLRLGRALLGYDRLEPGPRKAAS